MGPAIYRVELAVLVSLNCECDKSSLLDVYLEIKNNDRELMEL